MGRKIHKRVGMGKRIHQRVGTPRWEKAVDKSASRMARDLARMPPKKRQQAMKSYSRNKSLEAHVELIVKRGLSKANRRRAKQLEEARTRIETALEQMTVFLGSKNLTYGEGKLISRFTYAWLKNNLVEMKQAHVLSQTYLSNIEAIVLQLRLVSKLVPKEEAAELKEVIRTWVKRKSTIQRILPEMEREIAEREN